jgi:hypothetical protein
MGETDVCTPPAKPADRNSWSLLSLGGVVNAGPDDLPFNSTSTPSTPNSRSSARILLHGKHLFRLPADSRVD